MQRRSNAAGLSPRAASMSRRRSGWAALVFLLLAVVHTWPLVTGLDHLSRWNHDEWLNAWAVSWVAHQLPRDPVHLFDANIFYPNESTLAYTEPLIVPGLMGGASTVARRIAAPDLQRARAPRTDADCAGHVRAGRDGSGDHWGGLLAGALLAFSTPMLTRLPHLQSLHLYWLPLAILAFDRLLTRRRTRDAAWLGACVLGAALTSGVSHRVRGLCSDGRAAGPRATLVGTRRRRRADTAGGSATHLNAPYLLASTTHWKPLVNGYSGFRPPRYDEMARLIATFPSVPAIVRLQALGVRHVVVHTARYPEPDAIRQALAGLERRPELVLVAQEGPDQLYRVSDVIQTRGGALLLTLPWSDLTFVDGPSEGSYLRQSLELGLTFALQGPDQFLAHLEDTAAASQLMLRLPIQMTGRFFDAVTGVGLGELTVLATEQPTPVAVPAGYRSVILQLRARRAGYSQAAVPDQP